MEMTNPLRAVGDWLYMRTLGRRKISQERSIRIAKRIAKRNAETLDRLKD